MSSLETLAEIGKIAGGVVAAMTVMKTVTGWWRTGPGRRRIWAKDFGRLAPHVRPEFVEALFGAPAFELPADAQRLTGDGVTSELKWSDLTVTERVWPLAEDGYLVTWSGDSEVHAYSLTTASRRFRPKVRVGSTWFTNGEFTNVKLGRTRLDDLSRAMRHTPIHEVASWLGARRHDYYESYYFGNLGNYQTWSCGVSGAGYMPGAHGAMDRLGPDGCAFLRGDLIEQLPLEQRQRLTHFRAHAVVNSVMVQGMAPLRFLPERPRSGPEYDLVRSLKKPPGLLDRYRHRRWLREVEATEPRRRLAWLPRPRRRQSEPERARVTSGSQPPSV